MTKERPAEFLTCLSCKWAEWFDNVKCNCPRSDHYQHILGSLHPPCACFEIEGIKDDKD
jgi:hypothetical protein